MPRSWILVAVVALALIGCGSAPAPLEQDAYVWQRQWSPAVTAALAQSTDMVRDWRILAAQTDARGQLQMFAPDRAALVASGRPIVLVVRIDGQLAQWDESALIAQILALRTGWRGARLAGIEIDHDCGTARLPAYAHFLVRLKQALGDTSLSITALPAWLASADLGAVLDAVDEAVLQVHAVQSPRAGLFDVELARQWIAQFSARTHKSFRVALPTYGTRVSWDDDGRMVAVQSEAPGLGGGTEAKELAASPTEVAKLLASLNHDRPKGLIGVVWFRLPTDNDERAWSLPTWRAVATGSPLSVRVTALVRPTAVAGMVDVVLRNDGDVDVSLPQRITLPAECTVADGIHGYALATRGEGLELQRTQDGWLHGHHARAIGWARCGVSSPQLRIAP